MGPTGSLVDFVQEPIGLGWSQTLKQQSFHGFEKHFTAYQDIFHCLVSYPLGCPLSRILQVIEDISSLIIWLEKMHLGLPLLVSYLVPRRKLSQLIGFVIFTSAYPMEFDIPELGHRLFALYPQWVQ